MNYFNSEPRPPKLTREEEVELFKVVASLHRLGQSADLKVQLSKVLSQYHHWATYLVNRVAWGVLDEDEVASLASEALMRSAIKFDPENGTRFCTYARHRINGMARSRSMREHALSKRMWAYRDALVDDDKFNHDSIQVVPHRQFHLATPDCTEAVDRKLKLDSIREKLSSFPELTRLLVEGYYFKGEPLRELASKHGVCHETARQKIQKAIKELKELNDEAHCY